MPLSLIIVSYKKKAIKLINKLFECHINSPAQTIELTRLIG